jgi:hypothetical protein
MLGTVGDTPFCCTLIVFAKFGALYVNSMGSPCINTDMFCPGNQRSPARSLRSDVQYLVLNMGCPLLESASRDDFKMSDLEQLLWIFLS